MSTKEIQQIDLPSQLNVTAVESLYTQLLTPIEQGLDVTLNFSSVEKVDSLGVQLIHFFVQQMHTQNQSVKLLAVPELFEQIQQQLSVPIEST